MTQHQAGPVGGPSQAPGPVGTVAAGRPAVVNRGQLAAELGIEPWMVSRGRDLGIVPERTTARGWSRQAADEIAGRVEQLREAIADREGLGARRIAEEILAPATGLPAAAGDVPELAALGFLRVVDEYAGHPLFSVRDARALPAAGRQALAAVIAERARREAAAEAQWQAWCAVSLPPDQAAARLRWTRTELETVAAAGRITAGRGGRYPLHGLDELAADQELCEQVAGDRTVGAQEAAGLLELRPADFKLVVAAGWLRPATVVQARVGRRRWIDVPYYRVRDVEAVREIPGVDWEQVRGVRPGQPSALRDFVAPAPDRGQAVHAFAGRLAGRHQVDVWAYFEDRTGTWELEWARGGHGGPTEQDIAAELRDDTAAGRYRADIRLGGTRWGARTRWARPLTEEGAAVVLCTRATPAATADATGDGQGGSEEVLVQIAVVDAATGAVLLDAAVRPPAPPDSSPGPAGDGGREWDKVLPKLRAVTRGRLIVPGDPAGDRARITAATARAGKRPLHLGDAGSWALNEADKPVAGRTVRLPAGEACAYVHQELHRLAAGRGRHHQPQAVSAPAGTARG